eukprot:1150313-Pelagomonas_calceolata.AAC.4
MLAVKPLVQLSCSQACAQCLQEGSDVDACSADPCTLPPEKAPWKPVGNRSTGDHDRWGFKSRPASPPLN